MMRIRVLVVAITIAVIVTATVVVVIRQLTAPLATSANIPVTAAHGTTVRLVGATLKIPSGALSGDGRLVARTDGPQVVTSLGLNGKPGRTGKLGIASAGRSVSFELQGAKLVHPATLTLAVEPAAFAQAGKITKRYNSAWLAFYDVAAQGWVPVQSRYDPGTGTVTAQVSHLSTWHPFTWDWQNLILGLRQSLSAFDLGRAPRTECPKVEGITVSMANDTDPPLMGCVTGDAASGYVVTITNNRAYSVVLTPPAGAIQEPRDYAGFEEYVQSRDLVTKAIGGPYLGSLGTLKYRLPPNMAKAKFTGVISTKTLAVDLAAALASLGFDIGTGGYGKCVLDNVAHSGAARLSEAPKLVVECIPVVGLAMQLLEDAVNLQEAIGNVWSLYDRVFDTAMNLHGEVDVVRSMPVAPNGLTAKAVDATSVRLDWHDKSSFETGFQVYVNNVAASPIRAANTHTKLVTGLKPGTKYCFAIEALSLIGGSGKSAAVCAATPRLPIPDLTIFTGYELGKLYRHPNFPSAIGIDNHDSLAELVWSEIGPSRAVATGQLNYNDCAPGCAQGTYHKYGFEVTASNPKYCTVSVHADYSDVSVPVRAYVYSVITLRALSGTPEQFFVGTSVISTGCR